ncbi:hypothetical protein WJX84_006942 [Apatococcus fuscideae]|uniref:Uncharacterized protein n=1 Tax=Apatococcus fuscideae TaxID=2026836 RepID=A0AAW1SP64_9CHLO
MATDLLAGVRILRSKGQREDSQYGAAVGIQDSLVLLAEQVPPHGQPLPCQVWCHCANQLLDWTAVQLDKQLKLVAAASAPEIDSSQRSPGLSLWRLFANVLDLAQQHERPIVVPDVVSSITACSQNASRCRMGSPCPPGDQAAMICILRHLSLRRAENLLGSLEHSVTLAEAALEAAAAHRTDAAWQEFAVCAVEMGVISCRRALNQRKVFEAGTQRLMGATLPHLGQTAPALPGSIEPQSLETACAALLGASIFQEELVAGSADTQETSQVPQLLQAAASLMTSLMALEHRAVQPHQTMLWRWCQQIIKVDQGQAAAGASLIASRALIQMIRTAQQLRQLENFLQQAFQAVSSADQAQATSLQQILCRQHILTQLQEALASLPSGQIPLIIHYTATTLVPFAVAPDSWEPAASCIAQLATSCLQHVRVTGPQADTLAAEASKLAAAVIGGPLSSGAAAYCNAWPDFGKASSASGHQRWRLTNLLQLQQATLGMHAACCALQPQLQDMDWQLPSSASPGESCSLLKLTQHIFAADGPQEDEHQRLQSVFAASIIPRLRWLHEGILHLHFTCPKPDVLESMAEDTHANAQALQAEMQSLSAMLLQQATIPSSIYHNAAQGSLLDKLTQQQMMLPLIIQHLPVVVSEAPAPSLAAFVGSILMTASLPHNSHPAASLNGSSPMNNVQDPRAPGGAMWEAATMAQVMSAGLRSGCEASVSQLTEPQRASVEAISTGPHLSPSRCTLPWKRLCQLEQVILEHLLIQDARDTTALSHRIQPDKLLEIQLSLLCTPVPLPQAMDSSPAAANAESMLPYHAALPPSGCCPLRSSLLSSARALVAGQGQQERRHLHRSLLTALLDPTSAINALPLFELALLTLETRTAFTEEESVTRGLTGETADAFAAAISDGLTALCLQSLAARERAFRLAPDSAARMAHLPWQLLQARNTWGWQSRPATGQAVLAGQAGHLSEPQSLPLHSLALPAFGNSPSSACAEAANSAGEVLDGSVALRPGFKALGRVYTALADQQEVLGRYAAPILADYVATAGLSAQAGLRQGTETLQDSSLGSSAADALRQGACALYGICSASQVQHVHASLSTTAQGLAQAALSELRTEYETVHRYTGKA